MRLAVTGDPLTVTTGTPVHRHAVGDGHGAGPPDPQLASRPLEYCRDQEDPMGVRFQVVIDCTDPDLLAHFWAAALGYVLQSPPEGFTTWDDWYRHLGVPEDELGVGADSIVDPDGHGPRIWFQVVPDPRSARTDCTWTSPPAAAGLSRWRSAGNAWTPRPHGCPTSAPRRWPFSVQTGSITTPSR